jgi:hypothetical protein
MDKVKLLQERSAAFRDLLKPIKGVRANQKPIKGVSITFLFEQPCHVAKALN